ncbi:MAG TPA: carboxymuconolactone decarboxylase family protein [Candidatus Acidoferrales bacterium]|nr:carboxymuconolactone decarboxylase family protein [Candidatus Acidoferrales bacterium]
MATAIKRIEPAENEVLAALEAKTKQPSAFFRVMANRPEVLKNFPPLYGAIMGPGSVDRRLKEAVYLAVSCANCCAFCTAAHLAGAKKAGLTDEEISAVREETDAGFNDAVRAALAYVRELTRTANAAQNREALHAHFTCEQIVEITLVAAMANFTNRFNSGLDIQP